MMKRVVWLISILGLTALAACGSGGSGGISADPAARAVEDYLGAKIRGDADAIRAGLCAGKESVLEREVHTFDTVSNVSIQNMSCASDDSAAEDATVVRCSGEIVAFYGTEETTFPLASYRAVVEDGEWKWCGEGQ